VGQGGVFDQLHLEVLDRLSERGRLDWARASVDSASVSTTCRRSAHRRGGRRTRPGKVHGDMAYDSKANRAYLRRRGIRSRIARRGVESSARLGRHRWKVERSLSWLSCWRRLGVRWDRDSGRWFAFMLLVCAVVCFNRL